MGLDCSHDAWHGAYSAFNRWRDRLAELAGYDLIPWPAEPHVRSPRPVVEGMLSGQITEDNLTGDWGDGTPEDPLLLLLAHSDCDGYIEPKDCHWLALRLETLLSAVSEIPDDAGHVRNWTATTERFINGLRSAHELGERLEFG